MLFRSVLASGNIVARSHDALTINDAVNSSSGNIKLVAGRASGMSTVSEGTWGGAASFRTSPININAPVRSGYTSLNGGIEMYSTGAITQSASLDAGIQAFHTNALTQGKTSLITFNDTAQVGTITVENNKTSTANPVGIGNCGTPAVSRSEEHTSELQPH